MKKRMICHNCHKPFYLGYTGVLIDTFPTCDICADVKRDKEGNRWTPEIRRNGATFVTIATGEEQFVKWDDVKP
jgi:hypothetical protein